MTSPAPPTNVVPTVDANDQITLTWDHDPTWFAFDGDDATLGGFNEGVWYSSDSVDHFEIQLTRDAQGWTDPSGGPTSVTYDGSTSYSATYGPDSDNSYASQVGIDSMFKFQVRAVNADGASSWTTSGKVYTDPIPPHNPSVSRPDANTFTFEWTNQTDQASLGSISTTLVLREDTGSGYGNWQRFWGTSVTSKGDTQTLTIDTTTTLDADMTGETLKEDARYQFKIRYWNGTSGSENVYFDYGNQGKVFFEDDFESNDLSAWDSVEQDAFVDSDGGVDSGFSGADQGTYYCQLDASGRIEKNLGDLSGETDVIVKCAMAAGSMDADHEQAELEWYDGSSWSNLHALNWEYNEQGWVEVTALLPDSDLSTDNRVAFDQEGGGGDFTYVDRVVVSDILHEYTKPASPSDVTVTDKAASETVDGKDSATITIDWTDNEAFNGVSDKEWKKSSASSWGNTEWSGGKPYKIPESHNPRLEQGQKYDIRVGKFIRQPRNGSNNQSFWADWSPTISEITPLPAPSSLSITSATSTSLDASWTDNANDEDGHEVHYGTIFNDLNDWNVNKGGLVTDRVYKGSNSFYSGTSNSVEQARWTPFEDGKQPSEFTYYYQEKSSSTGAGVRLVNSNGNYEGGTATDNDEYDVDFANTNGHQYNPGHGYDLWVRVHWDFDWANDQVTVTFEQPDGTNSYTDTYTLKQGVDIEAVELWDYHSGSWGGSSIKMWWDNIHFTETVGADTTTYTATNLTQDNTYDARVENYTEHVASKSDFASGTTFLNELRSTASHSTTLGSSGIRVVDLIEAVSSYATASDSTNARVVDLIEGVGSHSTAISASSVRTVDLLESATSHSNVVGSSSVGVIDVAYGVKSHSDASSSSAERLADLVAAVQSHSAVAGSDTLRVVDLIEAVTSASSPIDTGAQAIIDLLVGVESHSDPGSSSTEILLDLLAATLSVSKSAGSETQRDGINYEGRESTPSYSNFGATDSLRVVDLLEGVESHTAISAAAADRSQVDYEGREPDSFSALIASESIRVIDLLESVESHSRLSSNFVYNDRTSLELIDHEVNWNDEKSFWYTNWFQESKIMGTEDTLAIRSLVVPDSKEPAARVTLQYDKDGNGSVDAVSDPIELGREQQVKEITGVPIDEEGYYRIKIMDYSGYNSLYAIDTAIVN